MSRMMKIFASGPTEVSVCGKKNAEEPFHRGFKYLNEIGQWIYEDDGHKTFFIDVKSIYFRSFDTMIFRDLPNKIVYYLFFRVRPDGGWSAHRISDPTYKSYDALEYNHPLRRLKLKIMCSNMNISNPKLWKFVSDLKYEDFSIHKRYEKIFI